MGAGIQKQAGTRFNAAGVCRLLPNIWFDSIQFCLIDHLSPSPCLSSPHILATLSFFRFLDILLFRDFTSLFIAYSPPHTLTLLCASWVS